MNAVQIIISAIGSLFVDKIGRRPMLFWVNVGCCICWIGVSAAAGIQDKTGSKASSVATVAMIYIFQAVYSFGWTPLQALYPVEVLSFEMRAKGMAFSSLFVNFGKSSFVSSSGDGSGGGANWTQGLLSTNSGFLWPWRKLSGRPISSSWCGVQSRLGLYGCLCQRQRTEP